jgi:hypothetical protein
MSTKEEKFWVQLAELIRTYMLSPCENACWFWNQESVLLDCPAVLNLEILALGSILK